VFCNGCSRVDHNVITGSTMGDTCSYGSCRAQVAGLSIVSGTPRVFANRIKGGSSGRFMDAIGVISSAPGVHFENNVIIGADDVPGNRNGSAQGPLYGPMSTVGFSGTGQVTSNVILGSSAPAVEQSVGLCASDGLRLNALGGAFRNNIISGGACGVSVAQFKCTSASINCSPDAFENNALYNGMVTVGSNQWAARGLLLGIASVGPAGEEYIVEPYLFTAADVDAYADFHASGTVDAACNATSDQHLSEGSPCIDAGTTTGAPLVDFDGQARDASPDIGADEYVP